MAVNLVPPNAQDLFPIKGVRIGIAEAGIRKVNRRDLTLIELAPGATVAGAFTQNRFCAAPVQVCKQHLQTGGIRALIINTGIANAGTGEPGLVASRATCEAVAKTLSIKAEEVLPFSTGVIMEPLPVDRIERGLPLCVANLAEDNWLNAAHGIMTTDTLPKAASKRFELGLTPITITGISKGAGMIKPNMATMLGFMATDAAIAQPMLDRMVREVADLSFNCISVDGDTSTNDSFMLIATGTAGNRVITDPLSDDYREMRDALVEVAVTLAQAIVRDGEGATKFITIRVVGGKDTAECKAVGYSIAHSPLVKTAFFASDPNLGRILAAIGNAGIADLDVSKIRLWLDDVLVSKEGGRNPEYKEEDGARVMAKSEITVRVDLARGKVSATTWTCDFSYDYVKINADYRS